MRYFTNHAHREQQHARSPRPLTEADPWWWCQGCADDRHADHVGAYSDPFGEDAACACPNCA